MLIVVQTDLGTCSFALATLEDAVSGVVLCEAQMTTTTPTPAGTPMFGNFAVNTVDGQANGIRANIAQGVPVGNNAVLHVVMTTSGGVDNGTFTGYFHDPMTGLAGVIAAAQDSSSGILLQILGSVRKTFPST
jgi:hypothetical protein